MRSSFPRELNGFCQRRQPACHRDRTPTFRPRLAIHPHKKLARTKGNPDKLHFQVFIPAIILDRNSQVSFHKPMIQPAVKKVSRARTAA